jgi:hypothetical protein
MTHRHGSPGRSLTPSAPRSDAVRHGPGVPVTAVGGQSEPPLRPSRPRWLLVSALVVLVLIAVAVAVWRRSQHAPIQVTGVAITQQTPFACGVDVTGRITTNGSAGIVSYQWVFQPQTRATQTLNQTVTAGQHAVDATIAVEGQGHGKAAQTVILEVLGPDTGTASAKVVLSC